MSPAWAQTCALSDTLVGILQPVVRSIDLPQLSLARDAAPLGWAQEGQWLLPPGWVQQGVGFLPPAGSSPSYVPPGWTRQGEVLVPPVPGVELPPVTERPPPVDQAAIDKSVASLCSALKGVSLPTSLSVVSITGFTGTIMGRLDSAHAGGGGSPPSVGGGGDGKMSLGALEKAQPAPQPGASGPLTVYASGTLLGGNSSDMPGAAGFTYGANSAMIGLELAINRNLILGLAASFTRMDTDIAGGSTADADVIHGAIYLSYSTRQFFFDALAAYGTVALDMTRPGTSATVLGSTDVWAVGLAARTGYLFDLGKLRVGPIAGISFVTGKVDGYAETGGDPTAMNVGGQSIESLTGSAGIRFLAPFQAGGTLFVPYLNVTLEHMFGDATGSVTTSLTQAPSAPVSLSFPVFGARDYGKVEGGITIELAPEASISLGGASTFARDDGQDYRFSAGLNYRF